MFNPQVQDWQQWLALLLPADADALFDRDREGNPTRALQWLDELACERCDWHPAIGLGLQALAKVGTPLADTAVVEFFRTAWSARLFADEAHAIAAARPDLATDPALTYGAVHRLADWLPAPRSEARPPATIPSLAQLAVDEAARALGYPYSALRLSPLAVACLLDPRAQLLAPDVVHKLLQDPQTAADALEFGLYAPMKPALLPQWLYLQSAMPSWIGQIRGLLPGSQLLQRCIDRAQAEIATPPPPLPH